MIDRADFPSTSDRPSLPADDLTFDVILFLTLAATTPGLLPRPRGPRGPRDALAILFALHVLALVAAVEAFYATQLGAWSAAHYGAFTRNLWATAAHFWRFVGCYAAAFLLWWFLVRPVRLHRPLQVGLLRQLHLLVGHRELLGVGEEREGLLELDVALDARRGSRPRARTPP